MTSGSAVPTSLSSFAALKHQSAVGSGSRHGPEPAYGRNVETAFPLELEGVTGIKLKLSAAASLWPLHYQRCFAQRSNATQILCNVFCMSTRRKTTFRALRWPTQIVAYATPRKRATQQKTPQIVRQPRRRLTRSLTRSQPRGKDQCLDRELHWITLTCS